MCLFQSESCDMCDARGGLVYQAGEAEKRKRKRAGWRKLVVDLPPGVQRRRESMPLVFESSGYVAKLARRYIAEWAGRARREEGRGERTGSPVPVPARRNNLSFAGCTIGMMRLQPSRICGVRCWSSCCPLMNWRRKEAGLRKEG